MVQGNKTRPFGIGTREILLIAVLLGLAGAYAGFHTTVHQYL